MADTGRLRQKLTILILAAALTSCSSQSREHWASEGTQSTGGGDASVSSPDQVNSAIDKALDLATEPDPQKNIFVQFWNSKGKKSKSSAISEPMHVFPQFASADPSLRFKSPFYQALKQNKIVRLSKGDCPHPPEEITASASVSEHTYNATICFSIGNLTRIPPSSLLQELTSLVLHETTHMGGAEEPEARAWQAEFVHYFGERFGNVLSGADTAQTTLMISKAYALLSRAQSFAEKDKTDFHILSDIVATIETISSLPDASDELALALKINPPHPELIEAYMSAVQEVVDFRLKIETKGPVLESYQAPIVVVSNQSADNLDIMTVLADLRRGLDKVNESFLAFTQN